MTKSFANDLDRHLFGALCLSTLVGSLTVSTLAFFSTLLNARGYSEQAIGLILSAPLIPTLVALFGAGAVLRKISCIQLMVIGQGLVILGFLGIDYSLDSPLVVAALRGLIGLGVGFCFSASTIYVRNLLIGPKTIYLFGIFSSMLPLPNAFGPLLAEWYFLNYGESHFFLVMALPAIAALIALCALLKIERPPVSAKSMTFDCYFQVLRVKIFRELALAIFCIGLMWGFVIAYISLYLFQHHFPIGFFFLPMSLALFGSRFGLLAALEGISNHILVGCSFGLIAFAFGLILAAHNSSSLIFSGIFFGVGYSLGFPILSVWVSDILDISKRPAAMSLFNAIFYCGIFTIPFAIGLLGLPPNSIYPLVFLMVLAISMGLFFSFAASQQRLEKRAHLE